MIDSSVENGEIEFLSGKARIIIPGVRNAQSDTVSQLAGCDRFVSGCILAVRSHCKKIYLTVIRGRCMPCRPDHDMAPVSSDLTVCYIHGRKMPLLTRRTVERIQFNICAGPARIISCAEYIILIQRGA